MILETFEYLLTAYAAEMSVNTSKGYPNWARPDIVLPCVALELAGAQPSYPRAGQRISALNIGFRGWLFARNEPELCRLLDALLEWHRTDGSAFEIAAKRVACGLQEVQRHIPDTSNISETHAVAFVVQVTY